MMGNDNWPEAAVLIHGPGAGVTVPEYRQNHHVKVDLGLSATNAEHPGYVVYELRAVNFAMTLPENPDRRRRWRWVIGVMDTATYDHYVKVCLFVYAVTRQWPAQDVQSWTEDYLS